MPVSQLYFWLGEGVKLLFMFAFGACVGSLVNVLVYRLPLGLSPISPPSRCPACQTKLTWRENIPVFGWLLLRGKCRFCKARISPEYPLVEAFVALLFVLFYFLWYSVNESVAPQGGVWAAFQQVAPPWALSGFAATWPEFVTILVLLGALTAMTLVDAKTFTIPLSLAWFPTVVGAVLLIGHACVFQFRHPTVRGLWPGGEWPWSIATPGRDGWSAIGASIGGILGLGVANALLAAGLIRRSFADYEAWEKSQLAEAHPNPPAGAGVAGTPPESGSTVEPPPVAPPDQGEPAPGQADLWIQYPHARREMLREIVFLLPCIALAILGAVLAHYWAGPWTLNPITLQPNPAVFAPLWLRVAAGVFLGYLIGGGVVWAVRILGSLAFGKEAMGLGDVHLMAAVGVCLGWIDSTLAFFGAAFVGLGWAVLGRLGSGAFKRAMPYGPFLAISTLLVLLSKPLLERAMSALLHRPIDLP